jgi:hypothetical protein
MSFDDNTEVLLREVDREIRTLVEGVNHLIQSNQTLTRSFDKQIQAMNLGLNRVIDSTGKLIEAQSVSRGSMRDGTPRAKSSRTTLGAVLNVRGVAQIRVIIVLTRARPPIHPSIPTLILSTQVAPSEAITPLGDGSEVDLARLDWPTRSTKQLTPGCASLAMGNLTPRIFSI